MFGSGGFSVCCSLSAEYGTSRPSRKPSMRTSWNRRYLGGPLLAMPNPDAIITPWYTPLIGLDGLPRIRELWISTSEAYSRKIPSLRMPQNVRLLNEDLTGTG